MPAASRRVDDRPGEGHGVVRQDEFGAVYRDREW